MAVAMMIPAEVEQFLKLKDDGQMVIIRPNLGKKMVPTIELVLSSPPGNAFQTMIETTAALNETMVQTSWIKTEYRLKPRVKSVFPAKRKSVKRMIFELIARYIASFFSA